MRADAPAAQSLPAHPTGGKAGRSGIDFPRLIFGTMERRPVTGRQRLELFQRALAEGVSHFDTAPLYGFGQTERLLGRLLRDHPGASVRVCTKVGLRWTGDARGPIHFSMTDNDGSARTVRRDARPESVRRDVEASLERLGVAALDLVQVHFRDADTPIAETMGALLELRKEGKLKAIGVSNFSLAEVQEASRALGDIPLASVQLRLNLLQRKPLEADEIVSWCAAHGIAVLAYSPLAEGRLARPLEERFQKGASGSVKRGLKRLQEHAGAAGTSPAALALGWLLSQPGVTSVVAGASSEAQLDELVPATRQAPDAAVLTRLGREFAHIRLRDPWEAPFWRRAMRRISMHRIRQSLQRG